MKRNILLALALLVAVSCVPVQAAESKSGWVIFKNSAKIVIGVFLTVRGVQGLAVAAILGSKKGEMQAQLQEELNPEINRMREEARANGEDMAAFEARAQQGRDLGKNVVGAAPVVAGVIGAGCTIGGIALIYSGYKGLTEEEEPVKA